MARYSSPVCPPQLSANVGVDMGLRGSRVYLVGLSRVYLVVYLALGLISRTLKQTNKQKPNGCGAGEMAQPVPKLDDSSAIPSLPHPCRGMHARVHTHTQVELI